MLNLIAQFKTFGLAALLCCCAVDIAHAQRVQFPTMLAQYPPAGQAPAWDAYGDASAQAPTLYQPAPVSPYQTAPYQPAPYQPAPYAPPPFQPAAVPPPQPYYAAPQPYYNPGPQPLYPDGAPQLFPPVQPVPSVTDQWNAAMRLRQEIRLEDTYLANFGGAKALGVNDTDVSVLFAIPFFTNQSPLTIAPGFTFHWWDGPVTAGLGGADLPPQTYDAYVNVGWHPQITPFLAASINVRPGFDTDFQAFSSRSFRIPGEALGILTLTPTLQLELGAVYLDRLKIKLLPAGGVIWTPDKDWILSLTFPHPEIDRRLSTVGCTQVWGYIAAEYGGGSWTVERNNGGGPFSDQVDYNDILVSLGIKWVPESRAVMTGKIEVGYAFERELIYRSDDPHSFYPSNTLEVRAGLTF